MNVKKWLLYTGSIVVFSLGSVFLVNYVVDPLWMYSFDNRFNSMQYSMDDRQLKTNKFYFRPEPEIDTLLIGSSRTSYISEKAFKDNKVFNFAEDNLCLFEIKGTIEAAKQIHGKDFDTIIIGFDFFGSSKGGWIKEQKIKRPSQLIYLEKASKPFYRFKSTLSFNTLKYSLINVKRYVTKRARITYDRDNIKGYNLYDKNQKELGFKALKAFFKKNYYGTYIYDENNLNAFKSIKMSNKNSKFIVFITPVHKSIYLSMIKNGLIDDYKRWLGEIVDVFGEVYDFTGINSVNINKDNYKDPQHFNPKIGDLVAKRIMNQSLEEVPEDFGILVNKDNIQQYVENINKRDKMSHKKYAITK